MKSTQQISTNNKTILYLVFFFHLKLIGLLYWCDVVAVLVCWCCDFNATIVEFNGNSNEKVTIFCLRLHRSDALLEQYRSLNLYAIFVWDGQPILGKEEEGGSFEQKLTFSSTFVFHTKSVAIATSSPLLSVPATVPCTNKIVCIAFNIRVVHLHILFRLNMIIVKW